MLSHKTDAPALPPELEAECDALMAQSTAVSGARTALPRLREIAETFPHVLKPNLDHLIAREGARQTEEILAAWQNLLARFPQCDKAKRYIVRWLKKLNRMDEAWESIERELPGVPDAADDILLKAELCYDLRDIPKTEALFQQLISKHPDDTRGYIAYARRLSDIGRGHAAKQVIDALPAGTILSDSSATTASEISEAVDALVALAPGSTSEQDTQLTALTAAIERFRYRRAEPPAALALGRVALITGGLRAGGAERQMVQSAVQLQIAHRTAKRIAGLALDGKIQVLVRTLGTDLNGEHGFFRAELEANGVSIREIDNIAPRPASKLAIADDQVAALVPLLPPKAKYGIRRMVQLLRDEKIEVAYVWQDGAILFSALAALIAGVPRIVLCMRGLPPIIRTHILVPAYEPLYRALARTPGVQFAANSQATANSYAEWIGMPASRVSIVYNGVAAPQTEGTSADEARWTAFMSKTGGPDVPTIGGVFRFVSDKRPSLWIDFAHAYLARYPKTRFVLVGGGPLQAEAREQAARLGISDRILFTGTSSTVGYWMQKMELLVLLSRFEGLPNVLIEAQTLGIPVVTTPAGGACEAFQQGVTGLALSTVHEIDMDELLDKARQVRAWKARDKGLGERIARYAEDRFSTEAMVERTVMLLSGQLDHLHAAA